MIVDHTVIQCQQFLYLRAHTCTQGHLNSGASARPCCWCARLWLDKQPPSDDALISFILEALVYWTPTALPPVIVHRASPLCRSIMPGRQDSPLGWWRSAIFARRWYEWCTTGRARCVITEGRRCVWHRGENQKGCRQVQGGRRTGKKQIDCYHGSDVTTLLWSSFIHSSSLGNIYRLPFWPLGFCFFLNVNWNHFPHLHQKNLLF